jgi:hypothetical protein
MKNRFLTLISALMLVSAVVVLNSCSKDDEPSFDSLTDAGGITISLTWDTGGTAADAIDEADWDVTIFDSDDDAVETSFPTSSSFDFIVLDDNDLTDGTYTVELQGWGTDADGDITVEVEGIDDGDSFSYNVDFTEDDDARNISMLKIVKDGNTYKITRL